MTTTPTEAWCPSCRVTHVPGTRRCIHCGGPVMPERPAAGAGGAAPMLRTGTPSPWPQSPPDDAEADEAAAKARPLRLGMAAVWVVLAIVTGILRACSENG